MTNLMTNHYEAAAVILFGIGFMNLLLSRNLIKRFIGLNIMDTAVYLPKSIADNTPTIHTIIKLIFCAIFPLLNKGVIMPPNIVKNILIKGILCI